MILRSRRFCSCGFRGFHLSYFIFCILESISKSLKCKLYCIGRYKDYDQFNFVRSFSVVILYTVSNSKILGSV